MQPRRICFCRARYRPPLALLMAAMLLLDAGLLPGLTRRTGVREAAQRVFLSPEPVPLDVPPAGTREDPTLGLHTRVTDAIETDKRPRGRVVAYWAVISVFAYYYEVIARFVFNSPTNWVHESMFLMYGMQYMLAGAYAYREDQHVRVDVIYAQFSPRGKAIADIITSVFFFIFIGTLFWTSYKFAADAVSLGEFSFTEWAVHIGRETVDADRSWPAVASGRVQTDQGHRFHRAWESLSRASTELRG